MLAIISSNTKMVDEKQKAAYPVLGIERHWETDKEDVGFGRPRIVLKLELRHPPR